LAQPAARANAVDRPEFSQDHLDFQPQQPRGSSVTFGKRKSMNTCPHCGKPANPFHLSLYVTSVSYTCTSCKKKSHFDRRLMGAIGSVGILGAISTRTLFHLEGVMLGAAAVGGTLVLVAAMYFLLTLRRVDE
jgi:hypothetical protein